MLDEVLEGSWSDLVTKCSFSPAHPLPPSHCSQPGWVGCSLPWHDKGGLFSSACLVLVPLSLLSAFAGLALCLLPHSSTPLSAPRSWWHFLSSPGPSAMGFEVPAEEHSRLSQEPFPFQYQQRSKGGKSPPWRWRFSLVTYRSWAGKAQPVRRPWLVGAGRATEHPRGCCSQELGSLSPSHCQHFQQAAEAPKATLAGNLLQSEPFSHWEGFPG